LREIASRTAPSPIPIHATTVMSSLCWLLHIVAFVTTASASAADQNVFEERSPDSGIASQHRVCSPGTVGLPGSSFIQKMEQVAAAQHSRTAAAEQAGLRQGAAVSSFHGGQVDRTMSDLFMLFFLVALLLFVAVLGFAFLDSSHKKRQSAVDYHESLSAAAAAVEASNSPRTLSGHHSPRPAEAGGGFAVADAGGEPDTLYLSGPELVVPDGAECNLVISSIEYQYATVDQCECYINDTEGTSLLRGVSFKNVQPDGTRIMLQSRDGSVTWGRCKETGRRAMFKLHRGDDPEPWGTIQMTRGGKLSLQTMTGHRVKFEEAQGSAGRRNTLRLLDSYGVLLCLSEMSVGGRAVRVGPLVDIGFVILSHLAIDVFQLEEFGELR